MAGERLYELIKGQHIPSSERSDIVYGKVLSSKPLKVQLSNQMVLDENFIVLGKHIGKFKLQGKSHLKGNANVTFHGHNQTAEIHNANIKFPKKEFYIEFDNSLEKGDKVTMIRCDGGQKFYLFERVGEDGYGF
ncbi:DUF2577 domain-containing protein [uncultured Lactobacillus sp.]|uniref:DUF2577 domain-containing protein n=1 Tax=uncultured Lactobacillus sp. TaxID=153152 RepID=UPI002618F51D|nr:DUF2577 domain-containing protein [uncultured Lactobacillus sp.]